MAGQTVSLGAGKANFVNTLATYACMKVAAPFNRTSALTSGKQHSRSYSQAGRLEHYGGFMHANVEQDHGTVILLQVSWKRNGAPIRDGALFLRLRTGAPLYSVSAKVPTDAQNTYGDRLSMFSGYADIMNAEELQLIGILPNRSYTEKFMAEEELEECFNIQMQQAETIGKPQITAIATPTGVQLREVAQEPMRRMIFRKRG